MCVYASEIVKFTHYLTVHFIVMQACVHALTIFPPAGQSWSFSIYIKSISHFAYIFGKW